MMTVRVRQVKSVQFMMSSDPLWFSVMTQNVFVLYTLCILLPLFAVLRLGTSSHQDFNLFTFFTPAQFTRSRKERDVVLAVQRV